MTATDKSRDRARRGRKRARAKPADGRLRAQGLRTRNAIVAAARALLLDGGSLEFTLRETAVRAGITISNVQYYFPSRQSLLRAVFEPVVEACLRDLRRATAKGAVPRETLAALAAKTLHDAQDRGSAALWCRFLSLGAIDPGFARMLEAWYKALVHEIAGLVNAVNPALGPDGSRSAAILMIALADGVCVRNGVGGRQRGHVPGLDAAFLATVARLLDGDQVPG